MAMRLQELHPSLVHFLIALLPTALAADTLGRISASEALMAIGRRLMPVAAASAAVAGVAGLISQEVSQVGEDAHPYLITHRNLNLGLIAVVALLARKRARRKRPSPGYLLTGLGGPATMTYTAYLGGHMVYAHGVGVKPAGGVSEDRAPELTPGNAREVLSVSAQNLRDGWQHAVEHLREGEIAPVLTRSVEPRIKDEAGGGSTS